MQKKIIVIFTFCILSIITLGKIVYFGEIKNENIKINNSSFAVEIKCKYNKMFCEIWINHKYVIFKSALYMKISAFKGWFLSSFEMTFFNFVDKLLFYFFTFANN